MKRTLVSNERPRQSDGVIAYDEHDVLTLYRYIDDTDEDGDTLYEVEEYLRAIPGPEIRTVLGVENNLQVFDWFKKNLIAEESNSLDAIIEFLDQNCIPYVYDDGEDSDDYLYED